ncbi:transcriptional regulator NrdR [bacterium]|jgi:transcriptional repressor NrdR|nr:transcriptional regulator NrdR [Pirellulaceae bacterium]MDB4724279.1 transcriptional regulator NrdR [bacterium]
MKCPYCRKDNDKVIDSRGSDDGFAIRRRRECLSCNRRYTTYERLHEVNLKVVKKDDVRDNFDASKIRDGLQKACWKRPVAAVEIENMVSRIEQRIYSNYDMEIDSRELGDIVMNELIKVDQVAYVRFASVYREFKDVRDFVDELEPMLRSNP